MAPTFDIFEQYQHLNMSSSEGTTYIITTPNYPSSYLCYLDGIFIISAPINSKVRLEIKDFQMENGYDGIYIGEGSTALENRFGVYTGTTKLRVVASLDESLWIYLISSTRIAEKGFVMYADVIDQSGEYNYSK